MLETLASRFQTIVLVGLVTLLSLVFVLQFGGPQAEGCTSGGSTYAARVDGETITAGDFTAAYILAGFNRRDPSDQRGQRLWKAILDGLIERNLLATEAREIGYHVTERDVMDRLADEGTVRLSLGVDAPMAGGEVPVRVNDEDGNFDAEAVRRLIHNRLRRHVGEFSEAQIEEELAERMRQTIRASVSVSEQEAWEGYVRERDNARIKYLQFRTSYYRDSLDPTEADIRAWMAENTLAVDEAYESNAHRYTDLDPQVHTRHIVFRASEGDDTAREEARGKAEAALVRIQAGEDFAVLAEEISDDTVSARRGGDLGWAPRGRNPAAFDEVAFEMTVGTVSEVVETPLGFHVIELLGKREGDVPEDEAKLELSEDLFREARSKELAEEAANAALEALRGGVEIDDLDAWLTRYENGTPEATDADILVLEDVLGADGEEIEIAEDAEDVARPAGSPSVTESSSFSRTGRPIAGVDGTELVRDVFGRTLDAPLPDAPIQLGNVIVIYKLTEREEATREEFEDGVSERIRDGLLRSKQAEAVEVYVRELRAAADASGRVRVTLHELEVTVEGRGTVNSDPNGIRCGDDCRTAFEFGNMVQLMAEPAPTGRFLGWTGACSGSGSTCIVTMNASQTVAARFSNPAGAASSDSEDSEDSSDEESTEDSEDE